MIGNIVTTQADELRAFFARVRPCYRELFNMAHAICGNYELAEYAVQSAILDVFRRGTPRSRAGLARDPARAQTRAMAVEQARLIDDAELTWDGFRADAIEGAERRRRFAGRLAGTAGGSPRADAALWLRPERARHRPPAERARRAGHHRAHALCAPPEAPPAAARTARAPSAPSPAAPAPGWKSKAPACRTPGPSTAAWRPN